MANYIKESLEEGEEIIFKGKLHWLSIAKYLFTSMFLGLLGIGCLVVWMGETEKNEWLYASLAAILLGLMSYGLGRIIRTRTEFAVTTSRFIQKDGIFDIKMTEIPLFKIETVNFYQSLFQRVMDTGNIELVGSGGTSHKIDCVAEPMKVRKVIVASLRKEN